MFAGFFPQRRLKAGKSYFRNEMIDNYMQAESQIRNGEFQLATDLLYPANSIARSIKIKFKNCLRDQSPIDAINQ